MFCSNIFPMSFALISGAVDATFSPRIDASFASLLLTICWLFHSSLKRQDCYDCSWPVSLWYDWSLQVRVNASTTLEEPLDLFILHYWSLLFCFFPQSPLVSCCLRLFVLRCSRFAVFRLTPYASGKASRWLHVTSYYVHSNGKIDCDCSLSDQFCHT